MSIWFTSATIDNSESFTITVIDRTEPELDGTFPLTARAGAAVDVTLTIKYLNPAAQAAEFTARMLQNRPTWNTTLAPISSLNLLTALTCTRLDCSISTIILRIPGELVPPAGATVTIELESKYWNTTFDFVFESSFAPEVLGVSPTTLVVTEIGTVPVQVFISNADPQLCVNTNFSCSVTFGGVASTLVSSTYTAGVLVVTLMPPDSATFGTYQIRIIESSTTITAQYTITVPDATMSPIDGPCTGGATVTLAVFGLAAGTLPSAVAVTFDGFEVTPTAVSAVPDSPRESQISVVLPRLGTTEKLVLGAIVSGGFNALFDYECFGTPTLALTPNRVRLDTITSGYTVEMSITGFPAVGSAQEVTVSFGDSSGTSIVSVTNAGGQVILLVNGPSATVPGDKLVTVRYVGGNAQVATSTRVATAVFTYFRPTPTVVSSQWCAQCAGASSCIVQGLCGGGVAPRARAISAGASGTVTLVTLGLPAIPYTATGALINDRNVVVRFGLSVFAVVQRVVFSDDLRTILEIGMTKPLALGALTGTITVQLDPAVPVSFTASFFLSVFDETVSLTCSGDCSGGSEGTNTISVLLTNYALTPASVDEFVSVRFGSSSASNVVFGGSDSTGVTLRVTVPSYDCSACAITEGSATVALALSFDGEMVAFTEYTFWSPPALVRAGMDSSGTTITAVFDQITNRANMSNDVRECGYLFNTGLSLLGDVSSCSWNSDTELFITLGANPTVLPGDIISIASTAGLRSANEVSRVSISSIAVAAPRVLIPPSLQLSGPTRVDPCSDLSIRATVSSSRPVTYAWGCLSDSKNDCTVLNNFVAAIGGPRVFLPQGTPQMATFDRTYRITCTVTDFLGTPSETQIIEVYKLSSPVPTVVFTPAAITTTTDQENYVNGKAVFSTCPVQKSSLRFTWTQLGGPALPASILGKTKPQLKIRKDVLLPGSLYVLRLRATMQHDPSKYSESTVTIRTLTLPLVAQIAGGSGMRSSTLSPLVLDASDSYDPNDPTSMTRGMTFSWSCVSQDLGLSGPCRDSNGTLLSFNRTSVLTVAANTLTPLLAPYTFTVSVTKSGRPSSVRTFAVTVLAAPIPSVSIRLVSGGVFASNGRVRTNGRRLVFVASSDRTVSYTWSLDPTLNNLQRAGITPLGTTSADFILMGRAAGLVRGGTYSVVIQAAAAGFGIGQATLNIGINTPPSGGSFSICRSGVSGCVTTGAPLADTFSFLADG
eukprot:2915440-Rhodomonas_salina.1